MGCPGLPDKWDDLPHNNHGDAWKWTDIEKCPLNDSVLKKETKLRVVVAQFQVR